MASPRQVVSLSRSRWLYVATPSARESQISMSKSPQTVKFTKMQGVGNDFVVVDGRALSDMDWSGLAREICDRRFGVGADGLLVIDTSRIANVMMRMYNPDGTP